MLAGPGLDALIEEIHARGIAVGIEERLRLQHVLAQEPSRDDPLSASATKLESIIAAIVVKRADQRDVLHGAFESWYHDVERALGTTFPSDDTSVPTSGPRPRPKQNASQLKENRASITSHRRVVASVAVVLVCCFASWLGYQFLQPLTPPSGSNSAGSEQTRPLPPTTKLSWSGLANRQVTVVANTTVAPSTVDRLRRSALPLLGIAVCFGFSWWLSRWQRSRTWSPPAAPLPTRPGPSRVLVAPENARGPLLLSRSMQDEMVWGVDRYCSDVASPSLDVNATVQATASAGGFPQLIFERRRHAREVWLWLDQTTENDAAIRMAHETALTLSRHGLSVEVARYSAVPESLATADDARFEPHEVEERRNSAFVAIFTDGQRMLSRYAEPRHSSRIDAVMRGLSRWPRLTVVDFSSPSQPLAPLLNHYEVDRVDPDDLPRALTPEGSTPKPPPQDLRRFTFEEQVWAGACALCPAPVRLATATALRAHLDLSVTSIAIRRLLAEAPSSPEVLEWGPAARAARVNWLYQSQEQENQRSAASWFAKAFEFWIARYDEALASRAHTDAEEPWLDTAAHRQMQIERALLGLWRDAPGDAVRELHRLRGSGNDGPALELAALVRQQLRQFVPRSSNGQRDLSRIELPWTLASLSPLERALWVELTGQTPDATSSLRPPGRVALAVALPLGFALASLLVLLVHPRYRAESVVQTEEARRCLETAAGGLSLLRCDREGAKGKLRLTGITRGMALIEGSDQGSDLREFALDLVDSGTAETVVFGPKTALNDLSKWPWPESRIDAAARAQVLEFSTTTSVPANAALSRNGDRVFAASLEPGAARAAMQFAGEKRAVEVWPVGRDQVAGDPAMVRGIGDNPDFRFVQIPAGTFLMGSPQSEAGRSDDEGPQHRVTVSAFEMMATEVTRAQFLRHAAYDTEDGSSPSLQPGQELLPQANVSWTQADQFCRSLGYRLPTEAEWEYACRAGTTSRFSFGDDDSALDRYAWYRGNSDSRPHAVGAKQPNQWGLYDMHGNVWEWVNDWYAEYAPEEAIDPTGPKTGAQRVLRGGAFIDEPRYLRSAFRLGIQPEISVGLSGFRCVRSSRRQP